MTEWATCGKNDLIEHVNAMRYFGIEDLDDILINPNTDQEVFELLAKYVWGKENIAKLLHSPLLTRETFEIICSHSYDDSSVFADLLASPYLTAEIYEKILLRKPYNVIDELLQSKFASEQTCMVLLDDRRGFDLTKEIKIKVARSPYFTEEVLKRYMSFYYEDDETLLEVLKKHVATPELITQIRNYCIKYPRMYAESIKYIIVKYGCDYDYIKNYVQLNDENVDFLLSNGMADTEMIKKLVNDTDHRVALRLIANNSSLITEDILIQMINKDYSNTPYGVSSSREQVFKAILERPNISEAILCAILNNTRSNNILNMISMHPAAGTDTKVSIIINKPTVSENDLETLFSIPGLNENHIIQLLEKHSTELVFRKVMTSPLCNQKIYRQIIMSFSKKKEAAKKRSYYDNGPSDDILMELLNLDLDENNLCYLLGVAGAKYDIVKKTLQHASAGLDVCKKANVICDEMEERKREEIADLSGKLKHKIISETFEIEEEEDVKDILKINVEDGMTTMLWGPSGVGKSSRVFEVDPTATMLILKNGMYPEEVVGGKEPNGEPGEIYPPHWYVVLCEKCKREPDRQHILFIDEFTNVSDTIKNLVWEVVGSRLVKGNEEWPLPDNCSIVIAGNRPEESSAVRIDASGGVMPAPLHNRIDSMLEIEFNLDEWQKWALETNPETGNLRIHPIVLSFCVAHSDKVMFTPFNPEDITQPFLTPRKWEQLSDAIYKAEARGVNHHVSYARLRSMIGNTTTYGAFVEHYERLPIDMNKIMMGEYSAEDFPSLEDKLYALGIIIAQYNGDQETIESFILECLGDEFLSVYNNMRNERQAVLEATNTSESSSSMNGGKK